MTNTAGCPVVVCTAEMHCDDGQWWAATEPVKWLGVTDNEADLRRLCVEGVRFVLDDPEPSICVWFVRAQDTEAE